jgi:hypothetical protein
MKIDGAPHAKGRWPSLCNCGNVLGKKRKGVDMRPMHVSSWAVVQSCLLEAKSYNRVLKYQRLATLNSPVLGNLRQSPLLRSTEKTFLLF